MFFVTCFVFADTKIFMDNNLDITKITFIFAQNQQKKTKEL